MSVRRLFVALPLPGRVRETLIAGMGGVAGARWQDESQLHCTVRFLGEVDRHLARDVEAALAQVRHPPVKATLDGLGTFDRRGHVDSLWIGVSPLETLRALHSKIDRALGLVGVPSDPRAYTPHVTLARFARSMAPPTDVARRLPPPQPLSCRFERLQLYESLLGSDGATYAPLATYRLR